jgi:hypothetical protein
MRILIYLTEVSLLEILVLSSVIFQKRDLFIATAVGTSNPK